MLFSVQRFLEDYFNASGLQDHDWYAAKVANIYTRLSPAVGHEELLRRIHSIGTRFYRVNSKLNRNEFEPLVLDLLSNEFPPKKVRTPE